MPRRALLSCSDKTGLVDFARELINLGFELISTGGTRQALQSAGLPVTDIAEFTGFPEILGGRVKTLHPKVHGGILGRMDQDDDVAAMRSHGLVPIELVVVNLYPFAETIARADVRLEEAIEQIDIGGPSMIRSAAKNHRYVTVVTHPGQYERVLTALKNQQLTIELRRELAAAAFALTAHYDQIIADYFQKLSPPAEAPTFPPDWLWRFQRRHELRYGENPHQRAAWYVESDYHPSSLAAAEVLHGKELSYNNLLDLDAALNIVREFSQPAAVVIKHNNPCGCALSDTLSEAYQRADAGDPVSAFGGILGFNQEVDTATVELLCTPGRFVEAIIAPGYSPEAFEMLTTRPRWKVNVRLLRCPGMNSSRPPAWDYRRISGGLLVQDADEGADPRDGWEVVTKRSPTENEWRDLEFAWTVCKYVKSNAILLASDCMVVGVGAGQMSRLDATRLAITKAGARCAHSVCASDAFFPFRDNVDELARVGVRALIQPGGSKRDAEVIAACDEYGMAVVFTHRRHFRH